jgi:hypothetical protein
MLNHVVQCIAQRPAPRNLFWRKFSGFAKTPSSIPENSGLIERRFSPLIIPVGGALFGAPPIVVQRVCNFIARPAACGMAKIRAGSLTIRFDPAFRLLELAPDAVQASARPCGRR